jgi:hypothetical protein
MKSFILILATLLCFVEPNLFAECKGKVDLGVIALKVDMINSGKTTKSLNMVGIRGDAAILFYKGFCVKPVFIFGRDSGSGRLASGSIAFGHYVPLNKQICLLPSFGISASEIKSTLKYENFGMNFKHKEKFKAVSPLVGVDVVYSINDDWIITGVFQYAWARTHTHIEGLVRSKGRSQGSNLGLLVDYYLNKQWSINAGLGYNSSLSKEKHGSRILGGKVGLAYWF